MLLLMIQLYFEQSPRESISLGVRALYKQTYIVFNFLLVKSIDRGSRVDLLIHCTIPRPTNLAQMKEYMDNFGLYTCLAALGYSRTCSPNPLLSLPSEPAGYFGFTALLPENHKVGPSEYVTPIVLPLVSLPGVRRIRAPRPVAYLFRSLISVL
ncbi:hypothetical protein FRB91_000422 [Serendipita sp. 411]|nr:hypothetical protein FRB91_000422 [Serendipita sp. 411]